MAARVAQSMTISLLDYIIGMHCGIQFSMTSSIKLEMNNIQYSGTPEENGIGS